MNSNRKSIWRLLKKIFWNVFFSFSKFEISCDLYRWRLFVFLNVGGSAFLLMFYRRPQEVSTLILLVTAFGRLRILPYDVSDEYFLRCSILTFGLRCECECAMFSRSFRRSWFFASTDVRCVRENASMWSVTWLILPAVICLDKRLSHACLWSYRLMVNLRMAH